MHVNKCIKIRLLRPSSLNAQKTEKNPLVVNNLFAFEVRCSFFNKCAHAFQAVLLQIPDGDKFILFLMI